MPGGDISRHGIRGNYISPDPVGIEYNNIGFRSLWGGYKSQAVKRVMYRISYLVEVRKCVHYDVGSNWYDSIGRLNGYCIPDW
jgi:hypothetical protein